MGYCLRKAQNPPWCEFLKILSISLSFHFWFQTLSHFLLFQSLSSLFFPQFPFSSPTLKSNPYIERFGIGIRVFRDGLEPFAIDTFSWVFIPYISTPPFSNLRRLHLPPARLFPPRPHPSPIARNQRQRRGIRRRRQRRRRTRNPSPRSLPQASSRHHRNDNDVVFVLLFLQEGFGWKTGPRDATEQGAGVGGLASLRGGPGDIRDYGEGEAEAIQRDWIDCFGEFRLDRKSVV